MMLMGSLEKPCGCCIFVFLCAEPVLQIDAEHPLRSGKPRLSGELDEPKRGCRILVIVSACPAALLLQLLCEPELAERIAHFGRSSEKLSCVQSAPPEPANTVFFHNPSHHKRPR